MQAEVRVIKVVTTDYQMAEAFRQARHSLPSALGGTQKKHGYFSPSLALWVAVPVPDQTVKVEMIWVDNIRRKGKGFQGTLAGHPRHMPGKALRSPITFNYSQIADWAVQAVDGRYYGYFSTRVVLDISEPAIAAQIRATLVERPVPRLWADIADEGPRPEDVCDDPDICF
ncbi:DUF2314 domain-containing protein [Tropicibacter oceani]|uniref:DUF2314 domain-containing protein n=1 Tax=Tropicibacter oceani TaxID=3058420 RepID=A0ABY8QDY6_9RHOB|nr:DUF2314 domain-containing protein [Tropicibacter oceani]WGW02226.1 DUF2314 domain-containing protein [Tropicibacter oceani]